MSLAFEVGSKIFEKRSGWWILETVASTQNGIDCFGAGAGLFDGVGDAQYFFLRGSEGDADGDLLGAIRGVLRPLLEQLGFLHVDAQGMLAAVFERFAFDHDAIDAVQFAAVSGEAGFAQELRVLRQRAQHEIVSGVYLLGEDAFGESGRVDGFLLGDAEVEVFKGLQNARHARGFGSQARHGHIDEPGAFAAEVEGVDQLSALEEILQGFKQEGGARRKFGDANGLRLAHGEGGEFTADGFENFDTFFGVLDRGGVELQALPEIRHILGNRENPFGKILLGLLEEEVAHRWFAPSSHGY